MLRHCLMLTAVFFLATPTIAQTKQPSLEPLLACLDVLRDDELTRRGETLSRSGDNYFIKQIGDSYLVTTEQLNAARTAVGHMQALTERVWKTYSCQQQGKLMCHPFHEKGYLLLHSNGIDFMPLKVTLGDEDSKKTEPEKKQWFKDLAASKCKVNKKTYPYTPSLWEKVWSLGQVTGTEERSLVYAKVDIPGAEPHYRGYRLDLKYVTNGQQTRLTGTAIKDGILLKKDQLPESFSEDCAKGTLRLPSNDQNIGQFMTLMAGKIYIDLYNFQEYAWHYADQFRMRRSIREQYKEGYTIAAKNLGRTQKKIALCSDVLEKADNVYYTEFQNFINEEQAAIEEEVADTSARIIERMGE